jgi:hypothetical protein
LKEIRLNNKVSWLETVGRENTTFYWNLYPRLLFLFLLNWKIVDLNFEGLANRGIYIGKHFQLVFLVTCVKIIFQNMRLITIRTIFFNWFSLILKYIFKLRKVVFFGKMVKSNICRRNISCSNTGWHLKRIWKTALHPMYGIVPRTLDWVFRVTVLHCNISNSFSLLYVYHTFCLFFRRLNYWCIARSERMFIQFILLSYYCKNNWTVKPLRMPMTQFLD